MYILLYTYDKAYILACHLLLILIDLLSCGNSVETSID